jgi:Flp pilus assembly pilin Flp
MKQKNNGFMAMEWAILTAVVVAALLAMFGYFNANTQERFRQAGDVFGGGEQYESGVTKVE